MQSLYISNSGKVRVVVFVRGAWSYALNKDNGIEMFHSSDLGTLVCNISL